ncbi:MAG: membrane-bound lytic murein transglycosylase MltA [Rhodobacteraceae bacterium HLUCCA12]|nr:MAG: membrane-bound lytic murein transglycosylase MltA [Rhodobacteraceae bacterium HLUCCA12]
MRALAVSLCLAVATPGIAAEAELLTFDALDGWHEDDHAAALEVFVRSCPRLRGDEWLAVCTFAEQADPDPRAFFERFFRPVLIGGREATLFTGYFEPELRAAHERAPGYDIPVHRAPPGLRPGQRTHTRAEIDAGALRGRGLTLGWLRNAADLYYLQMQGSGRLVFDDGSVTRLGWGGQNGHPRRSVSAEAVRRGILAPHEASARSMRAYVANHPDEGRALLQHDPSYVFFREIEQHPARLGPLGAVDVPLTPLRSLAVDPSHTPLGAPVWVERGAMRRLMVAQDTGGAIRGPQRADIFFGTGLGAEQAARRIRDTGRMVVLMPVELAFARHTGF